MKVLRAIKSFALNYAKWVESSYRKARDALREKDYEHFALNALAVAALTVAIPLAALWLIVFLWRTVLIYVLIFVGVLAGIAIALIVNNFDDVSKRVKAWLTKVDGNSDTMHLLYGVLMDVLHGLEGQMKIMSVFDTPCNGSWYNQGRTLIYRFRIVKLSNQSNSADVEHFRKLLNLRRVAVYEQKSYDLFVHADTFYILSLKDNGDEYVMDVVPISNYNPDSKNIADKQCDIDNAPQGFNIAPSTPQISNAYNLCNGDLFQQLVQLASGQADYEIPLQCGVIWSLQSAPHGIISGVTGSGKSFLLLYLLMMISIKGGILFLADPKRSDLYSLSNFMPKNRVQHDSAAICEMVSTVVGIMEKRYETMERERLEKESFQDDFVDYGIKPLVLVIEEMAAFVSSLDKKYRESFEQGIKDITMKGRQAGVFLCSVMQQPNANNISTESRSQMGLRVYLGKSGGIEYRMLFGEGREYPDDVCGGVGQGLYMLTGQTAQPVMLETPRMKKSQLATALKKALESQHDDLI